MQPEKPAQLRDLYVTKTDLANHGYTVGCKACDAIRAGTPRTAGVRHSEACRKRIVEALGPDNPRVQRIVEKLANAGPAPEHAAAEGGNDAENDENMEDSEDPPDMIGSDSEEDDDEEVDDKEESQVDDDEDMQNYLYRLEESHENVRAIQELVAALGGNPGKHRQRVARKLRAVVSEIYSPPRVTAAAKLLPDLGILPGMAMDLTTTDDQGKPWDFDDWRQRRKAEQLLDEQKPMFLIGTPMCTAFSNWQCINRKHWSDEKYKEIMTRARLHLRFTMRLYRKQAQAGRYFVHEHPAYATSWDEPGTREIRGMPGVGTVLAHQCQHGMVDPVTKHPIKKPTRYMSNSPHILKAMAQTCWGIGGTCTNGEPHEPCRGKTAKAAAIFPFKLCETLLRGMMGQLEADGRKDEGLTGPNGTWDREGELYHISPNGPNESEHSDAAEDVIDDVTGQKLKTDLVDRARKVELQFFNDKRVLEKVPIGTAMKLTGRPPIAVRWVDTNKGDDSDPEYRSRLVAKQIRFKGGRTHIRGHAAGGGHTNGDQPDGDEAPW